MSTKKMSAFFSANPCSTKAALLRSRVAIWYTYFQTKSPNLGKFWRALEWKMFVSGHLGYITAIWYILWRFGNLGVIWYILPPFWYILSQKIWQPSSAGKH
jgi:hypothetical protein